MSTIHIQIPPELEQQLREQAAASNLSVDELVASAIRASLGSKCETPKVKRDLSSVFDGTPLEDDVLSALEDQRRIDPELWK